MIARFAAVLVLALHLQPAVLPLLCGGSSAAQAPDCEEPMSPAQAGLPISAQQGHSPCLNPALCGISQTATLSSVVSIVSVTESRQGTRLLRPHVRAIEAPAPLLPPPEA